MNQQQQREMDASLKLLVEQGLVIREENPDDPSNPFFRITELGLAMTEREKATLQ